MLRHTANEPSIFRTKNWVEMNNESAGAYNGDIKFKSTILKSSLCEYIDKYILVKGTVKVIEAGAVN